MFFFFLSCGNEKNIFFFSCASLLSLHLMLMYFDLFLLGSWLLFDFYGSVFQVEIFDGRLKTKRKQLCNIRENRGQF